MQSLEFPTGLYFSKEEQTEEKSPMVKEKESDTGYFEVYKANALAEANELEKIGRQQEKLISQHYDINPKETELELQEKMKKCLLPDYTAKQTISDFISKTNTFSRKCNELKQEIEFTFQIWTKKPGKEITQLQEAINALSLQAKQKMQSQGCILNVHIFFFFFFPIKKKKTESIGVVIKKLQSIDIKSVNKLTKELLSSPPSEKLGDRNTMFHVVSAIFGGCIFYDSTTDTSNDLSLSLGPFEQRPLVLELHDLTGLDVTTTCKQHIHQIVMEMHTAIQKKRRHPLLEQLQNKLARVHQVQGERIQIVEVFLGSFCAKYTIDDLDQTTLEQMLNSDLAGRLRVEFPSFKDLKIHPLFFTPAFDVAMFDNKGNKDFANENSSFTLGPTGLQKKYQQPTGWTRYGLKVLGKYENDTWLHPFRVKQSSILNFLNLYNIRNWWRGYHGTGHAYCENVTPLNALAIIYKDKFKKARHTVHGRGVYCSPDPAFYPRGSSYLGRGTINLVQGTKNFEFMFQVAVKPGADTLTSASTANIWAVQNVDDIRVYGILVRDLFVFLSNCLNEMRELLNYVSIIQK
ncbi:hypothetical protein RFI_38276 [Reticulomyxa filosa]|uniref:Uncharacterized protein n=1 Tax=Reticulomyxa filosa TaxID=46433 RepID=X6LCU7_RETFI|nr:hypothetical protein RFI_38276 [Reticulomyxa filosa]|eukprot:ETN99205.1 hypothetical protein RFI_38276 [Reticulomyxa filosa]